MSLSLIDASNSIIDVPDAHVMDEDDGRTEVYYKEVKAMESFHELLQCNSVNELVLEKTKIRFQAASGKFLTPDDQDGCRELFDTIISCHGIAANDPTQAEDQREILIAAVRSFQKKCSQVAFTNILIP